MNNKEHSDNAATAALLIEAGFDMMRQNLRRRYPGASDAKIDALLGGWKRREGDAVPGDVAGNIRIRHRYP